MKKIVFILLTIFFLNESILAQETAPYFTSYPALSPDGQTLIFSYDGSLWRSSANGGAAMRLTAMQGIAHNSRISPDGKWLAFSNSQYGNYDVYLMPLNGGDIKQLTFHSADDMLDSWSWDSKSIYFTSNRYDRMSVYKINIDGGTPGRVFGDSYFDYTHNAFESPLTGEIFFDDTWESANFANRIGYKGAFNPEIQSYHPATKKYKQYTTWKGKDMWPTLDKKGNIYFVSDEANGQYNLYTFENGVKKQLTNFTTSIMHPYVNPDGTKVVFEKDFQLYIYDIASKQTKKINIEVYKNHTLNAFQNFEVNNQVSDFDVSGDGKKIAFISREDYLFQMLKENLSRK